jgi:hypothetical protein
VAITVTVNVADFPWVRRWGSCDTLNCTSAGGPGWTGCTIHGDGALSAMTVNPAGIEIATHPICVPPTAVTVTLIVVG